jgi:hypothetical protein
MVVKPRILDEDRDAILSVLFNDPHIFGYLRNTWSLRSLSRCLTNELDIPISFKHLQRITKDLGVRCKRPKLELLHGEDYEEGKVLTSLGMLTCLNLVLPGILELAYGRMKAIFEM